MTQRNITIITQVRDLATNQLARIGAAMGNLGARTSTLGSAFAKQSATTAQATAAVTGNTAAAVKSAQVQQLLANAISKATTAQNAQTKAAKTFSYNSFPLMGAMNAFMGMQSAAQGQLMGTSFSLLFVNANTLMWTASLIGLGAAVFGITKGLQEFSTLEDLRDMLHGAIRDSEMTEKAWAWLEDFNLAAPFTRKDIVEAATNMFKSGLDFTSRLEGIGNIAAANQKPIADIADLFANIAKTGKADMGQIMDLGVSRQMLRDMGIIFDSEGKIISGAREVLNALDEIGRNDFAGWMSKRMQSLGVQWEKTKQQIANLLVPLGETWAPVATQALGALVFVARIAVGVLMGIGQAIMLIGRVIKPAIDWLMTLAKVIKQTEFFQGLLQGLKQFVDKFPELVVVGLLFPLAAAIGAGLLGPGTLAVAAAFISAIILAIVYQNLSEEQKQWVTDHVVDLLGVVAIGAIIARMVLSDPKTGAASRRLGAAYIGLIIGGIVYTHLDEDQKDWVADHIVEILGVGLIAHTVTRLFMSQAATANARWLGSVFIGMIVAGIVYQVLDEDQKNWVSDHVIELLSGAVGIIALKIGMGAANTVIRSSFIALGAIFIGTLIGSIIASILPEELRDALAEHILSWLGMAVTAGVWLISKAGLTGGLGLLAAAFLGALVAGFLFSLLDDEQKEQLAQWIVDRVIDAIIAATRLVAIGGALKDALGGLAQATWNALVNTFNFFSPGSGGPETGINPPLPRGTNRAPTAGDYMGDWPQYAKGGIVTRPTLAMIGEEGPEAIVPLNGGGPMGITIVIEGNTFIGSDPATARKLADMVSNGIMSQLGSSQRIALYNS